MAELVFPVVNEDDAITIVGIAARPSDDHRTGNRDRLLNFDVARSRASSITGQHTKLDWLLTPNCKFTEQSHLLAGCLATVAADWRLHKLPVYANTPVWATGAFDTNGALKQDMDIQAKLSAFENDPDAQLFLVPLKSERRAQHSCRKLSVDEFAEKAGARAFWKKNAKVVVAVGPEEIESVARALFARSAREVVGSDRGRGPRLIYLGVVAAAVASAAALLVWFQSRHAAPVNREPRDKLSSSVPANASESGPSCTDALHELDIESVASLATALSVSRHIQPPAARRKCYVSQTEGEVHQVPHVVFAAAGLVELGNLTDTELRTLVAAMNHAFIGNWGDLTLVATIYGWHPEQDVGEALVEGRDESLPFLRASEKKLIQRLRVLDQWAAQLPSAQSVEPTKDVPIPSRDTYVLSSFLRGWQALGACADYPGIRSTKRVVTGSAQAATVSRRVRRVGRA